MFCLTSTIGLIDRSIMYSVDCLYNAGRKMSPKNSFAVCQLCFLSSCAACVIIVHVCLLVEMLFTAIGLSHQHDILSVSLSLMAWQYHSMFRPL